MKILADASENYEKKFIVEVSGKELANIVGESYFSGQIANVKVGSEVKVAEIFSRLNDYERNRKMLTVTADQIQTFADILRKLPPVIDSITCPESEETVK